MSTVGDWFSGRQMCSGAVFTGARGVVKASLNCHLFIVDSRVQNSAMRMKFIADVTLECIYSLPLAVQLRTFVVYNPLYEIRSTLPWTEVLKYKSVNRGAGWFSGNLYSGDAGLESRSGVRCTDWLFSQYLQENSRVIPRLRHEQFFPNFPFINYPRIRRLIL